MPSRQELDSQEATVKRAQADEASTAAQVAQSQASLAAIETDIRKAVIKSPINGIVLDRQVDPGQTVAASFQTPTLFTLAEDLTKMKLIIDVDEADIGNVKVGQAARFRVDAYPDRAFESRVQEVRSTPKTSNGVVTYQTVLTVDNARAPAAARHDRHGGDHGDSGDVDAVLVPNAALRFTPPAAQQSARRRIPVAAPAAGCRNGAIVPPRTRRRMCGPRQVWRSRPIEVPAGADRRQGDGAARR